MVHNLIPLPQFPSMPLPFSSDGPGEAWVWDDYVMMVQTMPANVNSLMAKMTGQSNGPQAMNYPFALTVFYRKDRNPHGPSSQPILAVCLEKMDPKVAAAKMRAMGMDPAAQGLDETVNMPVMVGIFTAANRMNLGNYPDLLAMDSARAYLMRIAGEHLALEGEPAYIGPIAAIHGHPDTGFPAQPKKKRGLGCLLMGAMAVGAVACCGVLFAWLG